MQQVQPALSLDPADHAAAAAIALKQQRQRNSRSRSRLEGEGELSDGSAFDEELDFGPEQECKYNDEGEGSSTAAALQCRLHLMRRLVHCGQLTTVALCSQPCVGVRAVRQSCSRPRRRC